MQCTVVQLKKGFENGFCTVLCFLHRSWRYSTHCHHVAGLRLLLEPNCNVKVKGALSTSCLQLLSPLRFLEAFNFQFYHFTKSCLISYWNLLTLWKRRQTSGYEMSLTGAFFPCVSRVTVSATPCDRHLSFALSAIVNTGNLCCEWIAICETFLQICIRFQIFHRTAQ